MKSPIAKRSIVIDGHKTSVSLEDAFWNNFKEIAQTQRATLSELVGRIDGARQHSNLSSAIRLFVLRHFHEQTEVAGINHVGVNGETTQAPHP
jgi:predicted DNA-binding ribbon-helix-helix protein